MAHFHFIIKVTSPVSWKMPLKSRKKQLKCKLYSVTGMHSTTICYTSGGLTPLEITSPQIEPYTDKARQEECSGLF